MTGHKTNWAALLLLVLAASIIAYLGLQVSKISYPEPVQIKYEKKDKLEKRILGELQIKYLQNSILFDEEKDSFIRIKHGNFYVGKNINGEIGRGPFYLQIFFSPNVNSKKLSVEDWYDQNNPENDRGAPFADSHELIEINGIPAYKVVYGKARDQLNSYFYDLIYIYISHNTDIYEIRGYQLPENTDPVLTSEDIQAAREYEKTFNEILQSIRFVE
jgi:hypothetical protein